MSGEKGPGVVDGTPDPAAGISSAGSLGYHGRPDPLQRPQVCSPPEGRVTSVTPRLRPCLGDDTEGECPRKDTGFGGRREDLTTSRGPFPTLHLPSTFGTTKTPLLYLVLTSLSGSGRGRRNSVPSRRPSHPDRKRRAQSEETQTTRTVPVDPHDPDPLEPSSQRRSGPTPDVTPTLPPRSDGPAPPRPDSEYPPKCPDPTLSTRDQVPVGVGEEGEGLGG